MNLPFSFSPSSITTYNNCPRKFKLEKDKIIVWKESPQKSRGTQVHEYLEARVKKAKIIPPCPSNVNTPYVETLIRSIHKHANLGRTILLEQELCVTDKWEPCDWFHHDCFIRAKSDLLIIKESANSVIVGDYKTGKIYPGMELQLKVYALLCYVIYGLSNIKWQLYYVDQGQTKEGSFDLTNGLAPVQDVLDIMDEATKLGMAKGYFPAKRNQFCRFCDCYHSNLHCPESLEW